MAQDWFTAPSSQRVMDVLAQNGQEARFIGGCVRDALLGNDAVLDIDIATPELPQTVLSLFEGAGIKAIPTGIDHGTVTVVHEGQSFEITTLRADVSTDGRRATVAFSQDWLEDAKRRDFTFNAMSLDRHGQFSDPFNGIEDLEAGRVIFIGDAHQRIREDYLRLLRFFRFSAFYGKAVPEADGLAACCDLVDGLETLSGERIAQELLRLLEAPRAVRWLNLMVKHSILQKIMPQMNDLHHLEMMCAFEDQPDALRRLAILLPVDPKTVQDLCQRLRFSKVQAKRITAARCPQQVIDPQQGENHIRAQLYHYGPVAVRDQLFIYWAEKGFWGLGPKEQGILNMVTAWQEAPVSFPLQGKDLIELGVTPGPEIGRLLKQVENWWCAQGCRGDKADCLAMLKNTRGLQHAPQA